MIFSVKEVVGGLPAKVARDFMWVGRWERITGPESVTRLANVSRADAEVFFKYCLERQWLELSSEPGIYEMTKDGIQAGAARIGKPLSRKKADQLIAQVATRAKEWNALPAVALFIRKIHVFGSYLSDAQLLGDVDLVVEFEWRPGFRELPFEKTELLVRKLAASQGWAAPREFLHVLAFWQVGMYRYLKSRQSAISFAGDMDTLAWMKCESRVVFES